MNSENAGFESSQRKVELLVSGVMSADHVQRLGHRRASSRSTITT